MTLEDLQKYLKINPEFFESVKSEKLNLDKEEINYFISGLTSKNYEKFYQEAKAKLVNDLDGKKILKLMLLCACASHDLYKEKAIEDSVFVDTMLAFTRFINEHKASYGHYGFDRDFWTGRQLSLSLFRLGTLEYELTCDENKKACISIHIPSDAVLSKQEIETSIKYSKEFMKKYYPSYKNVAYYCDSWLLSPLLFSEKLLDKNSNIYIFQSYFKLINTYESNDYKEWVFKNRDLIAIENFECKTTLQYNLKRYLLKGNTFINGRGILK